MRHVVYDKLEEPDISMLGRVSDAGLRAFAPKLAQALAIPAGQITDRKTALASIKRLVSSKALGEDYSTDALSPASQPQTVEVSFTTKNGEDINNSAVNRRDFRSRDKKDISTRLMRFTRHLNGWQPFTNFFLPYKVKAYDFIEEAIRRESDRYAVAHPTATDEDIANYIQRAYIAKTMPWDRDPSHHKNHLKKTNTHMWIDLGPKAQADLTQMLQEIKPVSKGDYNSIVKRPGWMSLENFLIKRKPRYYYQAGRDIIINYVEETAAARTQAYFDTHPVSFEEAERHVSETYYWRSETQKYVKRALSPEAQKDVMEFMANHPPIGRRSSVTR